MKRHLFQFLIFISITKKIKVRKIQVKCLQNYLKNFSEKIIQIESVKLKEIGPIFM